MIIRLILLVVVICFFYKMFVGRWPWQKKQTTRQQAVFRARQLLGVESGASREDIKSAHKRLVTLVHPDKGGSNSQMHEANAARDLLLDEIPGYDA